MIDLKHHHEHRIEQAYHARIVALADLFLIQLMGMDDLPADLQAIVDQFRETEDMLHVVLHYGIKAVEAAVERVCT